MENLSHVNSVAVDKTGTLSKGFFKVNNRLSVGMNSEDNEDRDFDPMLLAASLECKSTHPLANAIGHSVDRDYFFNYTLNDIICF